MIAMCDVAAAESLLATCTRHCLHFVKYALHAALNKPSLFYCCSVFVNS